MSLAHGVRVHYTIVMNDEMGIVVGCLAGLLACRFGIRWWRHRKAAKQADTLLSNIVKGKDAFRR